MVIASAMQLRAQYSETFYYNGIYYKYTNVDKPADTGAYNYWKYLNTNPHSGILTVESYHGHFNCHAFAWPGDTTVWVEPGHDKSYGPQIYYDSSGYYSSTTDESQAEIVVYGDAINNPFHSAVRLTNSSNPVARAWLQKYPQYAGWYVSKWDGGPIVIHQLDSCPYIVAGYTPTFYKKTGDAASANHISGSNYSITGPGLVCYGGSQFTLSCGTPKTFTVTWSGSSNISFPSGATGYPGTAAANGSGPGYVMATLHFADGTSDTVKRVQVWVGVPTSFSSISTSQWTAGPGTETNITVNGSVTLYGQPFNTGDVVPPTPGIIDSHGADSYTWSTSTGLTFNQSSNLVGYRYVYGYFSPGGAYGTFTLWASNACGSTHFPQSIYVQRTSFSMALSPNPATSEVTISLAGSNGVPGASPATSAMQADALPATQGGGGNVNAVTTTYTVRVIDLSTGVVYYTARKTGSRFAIPVDKLKNGTYTVEVSDGKTSSTQSLLVRH